MEFLDSVLPHLLLWLMRVSGVLFVLLGLVGLSERMDGKRIAIPPKSKPPRDIPMFPAHTFTPGVSKVVSWGRGNHFVRTEVADPIIGHEPRVAVMAGLGGQHGLVVERVAHHPAEPA